MKFRVRHFINVGRGGQVEMVTRVSVFATARRGRQRGSEKVFSHGELASHCGAKSTGERVTAGVDNAYSLTPRQDKSCDNGKDNDGPQHIEYFISQCSFLT
jgi:hypothetical protein